MQALPPEVQLVLGGPLDVSGLEAHLLNLMPELRQLRISALLILLCAGCIYCQRQRGGMQEARRHSKACPERSLLKLLHVLADVRLQTAVQMCRALRFMQDSL